VTVSLKIFIKNDRCFPIDNLSGRTIMHTREVLLRLFLQHLDVTIKKGEPLAQLTFFVGAHRRLAHILSLLYIEAATGK
jgi:hypothetical protein